MRSRLIYSLFLLTLFGSSVHAQDSLNVRRLGIINWFPTRGVAVSGNYAYVVCGYGGLRVMDISNPSSPSAVGFCDTPGYARNVTVSGSHAYVADDHSGLRVIDISNPPSPAEVGFYNTPGQTYDVAVAGNYAYLADGYFSFRVVDVSNPPSPIEVGFYSLTGVACGVVVSGNYAYVAAEEGGLRVMNISNPSSPTEVGSIAMLWHYYWSVAVSDNYAYLAEEYLGFRVISISNPSSPAAVSYYAMNGAISIAVSGSYVYVTTNSNGLRVIDVSNPSSPEEVGFYSMPGNAYDVAVSGCIAYLAGTSYFATLDISFFAPCPPHAPERLTIAHLPQSGALQLRWAPVLFDILGSPVQVSRYVVYSAADENTVAWDSIGAPVPPDTTVFIDLSPVLDRQFYQVKAVRE